MPSQIESSVPGPRAADKGARAQAGRLFIDPRSAGAFRISLGLLLLFHAWTHLRWYGDLYSPAGILPAQLLPDSQEIPYFPSLLTTLETTRWGLPAFVGCVALVYGALVIGWQTRAATCLSLLAFSSIAHRNPYLVMGADEVIGSVLLWSCLLPLGSRFSLDSRCSARSGPSLRTQDPGSSLAAFGILFQLSVIYFVTAWLKSGPSWWAEGSALERVLGMTEFRLPAARWLESLPPWCLAWLTRGALLLEYLLPALILSPWRQTATRRLAICGMVSLHVAIALVIEVGLFSLTMIALTPLLIAPGDCDRIEDFMRRQRRASPSADLPASATLCAKVGKLRAVQNLLAACLLLGLIQENASRIRGEVDQPRIIPALSWPWRFAAAAQRWTMFAPDPPEFDPQITVQVRRPDGTSVVLWDNLSQNQRRHDFLWKLFMQRAVLPHQRHRENERTRLRREVCRFFAGRWASQRSSSDRDLDLIEIEVAYIPTIRLASREPLSRARIASENLAELLATQ